MDIKNLPSLEFSRSITPMVAGDKMININEYRKTVSVDTAEIWNEKDIYDKRWFVISYADRPNKGKRPVDGDVRVHINIEPESWRANAQCITWSAIGINKTWKPNHDYMVKACQESQLKKEATMSHYNVERAHHIAIMTNELIDAPSKLDFVVKPDVINGLANVADINVADIKPIFTQAMSDVGAFPDVGMECLLRSGSLKNWYKGKCIGFDITEIGDFAVFAMCDDYPFIGRYAGFQAERIKPIQTDADKLRGHLWYSINGNVGVNDRIGTIIDKLIESPEYTITLNKAY